MADAPAALPDTRADVDAAKELLAWARREGYWFDTVTVGCVQIVGARDHQPNVKAQARRAADEDAEGREGVEPESIYATVGRDLPGWDRARGSQG